MLEGHLAFIESEAESVLIGSIAPATLGMQDIWVGGVDTPTEKVWHWVDGPTYWNNGTASGFVNWRTGEPNNSVGTNPAGENCMIIEGDNNTATGCLWDDRSCLTAYPYICEVPPS